MAMAPMDFFRGFFDMIVARRRDYVIVSANRYQCSA